MEKRDIIVIVVAIFIVLIMAMYIKPLVTGKEAKLIPDEISNLFKKDNLSNISEDDKDHPMKSEEQIYSNLSITSISPNDMKPNSTSIIEIKGKNFTESMEIQVFSDSHNQTFNTTFENDKLIGKNVVLSEGEWIVKIFDTEFLSLIHI